MKIQNISSDEKKINKKINVLLSIIIKKSLGIFSIKNKKLQRQTLFSSRYNIKRYTVYVFLKRILLFFCSSIKEWTNIFFVLFFTSTISYK